MKVDVLSYSMTGNTARVCDDVSERLGGQHHSIRAPLVGGGAWGMLRLGFVTIMRKSTAVDVPDVDLSVANTVVLGAPVWAWRLAVPMRSFLETRPKLPDRIALVLTSGSPKYPTNVFAEFAKLTGKTPIATLHVSEAQAKAGDFTAKVAAFCAQITADDASASSS